MFEEIASDAVQMLILLFWVMIAFIIISGALWVRLNKKA
jgi:heme/copper-type cytochrome/quinol oxidase subunit 4